MGRAAGDPRGQSILCRPALLKSLIAFWQKPPSGIPVFFGLFIGPTASPREIDEARLDSLYELEIAFAECPSGTADAPAPLAGRPASSQLLIDVKGNTHRTEICIDTSSISRTASEGRPLVGVPRPSKMPPHANGLAQALMQAALDRGLWRTPYRGGW